MDSAFIHFLSGAGEFLLVAAIGFGAFCAVTSFMRFQMMAQHAATGAGVATAGVSGLTVLVTERLAQRRAESKRLTLLLVSPNEYFRLVAEDRAPLAAEMLRHVETRLRTLVRREDLVVVAEAGHVAVMADVPAVAVPAFVARVAEAAQREPMRVDGGVVLNVSVRTGWAATEGESSSAQGMVDRARESLKQEPSASAGPSVAADKHHDAGESAARPGLLDPLTGVLKADFVVSSLQKYVAQFRRDEYPIAVLCVDVDYLKRYNQKYGRATGDKILKRLSEFLQRHTREEDLIGRFGDDEFIVAMSAATREALGAARRLVLLAKKSEELKIGEGLRFTVSIGVAGHPEHGMTAGPLLEASQVALSGVKARGRSNCGLPDVSALPSPDRSRDRIEERDIF
jgi:diguanylate cyclase (GGDEF)-like protein